MSLARDVLRRAFRGRLLIRRLPAQFGSPRLFVSSDASLRYLKPGRAAWDANLLRWAAEYVEPTDHIWDIGANVGVFTFAAAGRGASVMAVEPDPFLANALHMSKAANPGLDVKVLSAAVSDVCGLETLHFASAGRAANTLARFAGTNAMFGRSVGEAIVTTVTLDSLLELSRPDVVKIDVEGAESLAFAGAERLLSEIRPKFLAEIGLDHMEGMGAVFRRHNYRIFHAAEPFGPMDLPNYNTLAIPAERDPRP